MGKGGESRGPQPAQFSCAMSKVATKSNITLKGSVEIVTEFFGYSINSILYQRGIYPPETFRRVNKYGLTMLVTTDDALNAYLENVLTQLSQWLAAGSVHTDKSVGIEAIIRQI